MRDAGWIVDRSRTDQLSTEQLRAQARGAVLIVDGVDHPLRRRAAEAILEAVGGGVRVVVSGRAAAALESLAHRRHLDVASLSTPDLLLDAEELATLLAAVEVPHGMTADVVLDLTGGWPSLVRALLADVIDGESDFRRAERWLASAALGGLAPDLRRAAKRLSILDVVHPGAAGLLIDADPLGTVARLLDRALLRPLPRTDPDRTPPRRSGAVMPGLVRRVLHEDEHDDTEIRAAHADLALGTLHLDPAAHAPRVLSHARRGEAWDVLSAFWALRGPEALRQFPEETRAAYADLPHDVVRERPALAFAQALSSLDAEPDAVFHRLAGTGFHPPTLESARHAGDPDRFVEAVVLRMLHLRHVGRVAEADELGALAAGELDRRVDRGESAPSPIYVALLQVHRTLAGMLARNERGSTAELATRAVEAARRSGALPIASSASASLAVLQSAAGWNVTARSLVDELHRTVSAGDSPSATAAQHVVEAMLAVDALDGRAARTALERADALPSGDELWPFRVLAWGRYSLFFLTRDEMDDKLREAVWSKPSALQRPGTARMVLDAFAVLADVHAGRVAEAARRIAAAPDNSDWMESLRARQRLSVGDARGALQQVSTAIADDLLGNRERAQLLFIGASAALDEGLDDLAKDLYGRAIGLAAAHRLYSTHLIVSHARRDALRAATTLEPTAEVVELLAAFPDIYPEAPTVTLSSREADVLRELAGGRSHREIAAALFISVPTARTHLRSAYAKLGVNTGPAAVARAVELGLLGG